MAVRSSQGDASAIVKKILFEESGRGKVVVIDDEEFLLASDITTAEQLSRFLQLQSSFNNMLVSFSCELSGHHIFYTLTFIDYCYLRILI